MLQFASPAAFWAGAALALVPLLLHLIVPRATAPVALPTARFLTADARTRLRVRRTPRDPVLLALRLLFVLFLAAAVAGPRYSPQRSGTATIVLLDGGSAMAPVWAESVAAAGERLLGAAGGGALVVFDTSSTTFEGARVTAALLDSLAAAGPPGGRSAYAAALERLHTLALRIPAAESAAAVLITTPRWDAWSDGLAAVRTAAWPGAIELAAMHLPGDSVGRAAAAEPAAGKAAVFAAPGEGDFVAAALGALGWDAASGEAAGAAVEAASLLVWLGGTAPSAMLLRRVEAGATLVVSGAPPPDLAAALPWTPGAATRNTAGPAAGGSLHFRVGLRFTGVAPGAAGTPAAGARVIAVREDGSAVATAASRGSGCIVFAAWPLEAGDLPYQAEFPHAIERLAGGCRSDGPPLAGPLDDGARAVLERGGLTPASDGAGHAETRVAVAALGGEAAGRPLWRWALLAALAVALIETLLVRLRRGDA